MSLKDYLDPQFLGRGVDSIVGILSPAAAVKRSYVRRQMENSRLFDGATKGRRGDQWRKVGSDGPHASVALLKTLRQRSRDFSRNNGYAIKAVHGIASNVVGTGIVLQIKAKRKNGRTEIADAWKRWSETTACDYDGLTNFYGLQELAVKTLVESGEVLIRKRIQDSRYYRRTRQVPMQLQVMEPEFLASEHDTGVYGGSGTQVVAGIEYNEDGQKTHYHLYKRYPGTTASTESVRVPADEVIHLYRLDRAGQTRGIPWGAPVMLNLLDLDGYEDAELIRRKIASSFVAFVSQGEFDGDVASEENEGDELIDKLAPGIVQKLAAGESVTFGTPPTVTGYAEYATSVLHKIAAGYQVPYSVLTGDFSQVNFSSGRMGWLEFQRLIEQWRWNLFIPRALDPIWLWFSDIAEVLGMPAEAVTVEWTAPRREMIDPLKEVEATILEIKAGLISAPEAIRERGYDPDTVMEQMKEWNAKLDGAAVILETDPRQDPKRLTAQNIANANKTV